MPLLRAELPVPVADAEEVRRAAHEALTAVRGEAPDRSVAQWVSDAVEQALLRLWELLSATGRGALIGGALVLAVFAVVLLTALRVSAGTRRDPLVRRRVEDDARRSADEWTAEADAHARAARWRPALRCRYRALVADLAAAGFLDEVPGRTAREYLHEVHARVPEAGSAFEEATRAFERVWYGNAPVDASVLGAFDATATRVRDAASLPGRRERAVAGTA